MKRATSFLVALGVALVACSGSKEAGPNDMAQSGGASNNSGGASSGGQGGQGMGGANTSGGASTSGGAPANGGNAANTGGTSSGGTSSGGATSGGASAGGKNSGGASAGGPATGGTSSGGASSGGKSSTGGGGAGGGSGAQGGSGGSGGSAECAPSVSATNRALVAKAIDELFISKDITAVDRYWSDPYLQHNPIAKSGVSTFRSLMGSFITSASFQYERLLALADCELAVVYGRYSQTGVIFDMFRIKNGKIMEHWDSDTNQASEATGVDVFDETAAPSRALFSEFSTTVLIGAQSARAPDFLSTGFIEHRGTATGPTALTAYLTRENITYSKVHHVIADGNYVFALSEGKRGSAAYGFYDLFRVEGGKFAEHWDSRRAVPSSTQSGLPIF